VEEVVQGCVLVQCFTRLFRVTSQRAILMKEQGLAQIAGGRAYFLPPQRVITPCCLEYSDKHNSTYHFIHRKIRVIKLNAKTDVFWNVFSGL